VSSLLPSRWLSEGDSLYSFFDTISGLVFLAGLVFLSESSCGQRSRGSLRKVSVDSRQLDGCDLMAASRIQGKNVSIDASWLFTNCRYSKDSTWTSLSGSW
jgi:hypothetical protein